MRLFKDLKADTSQAEKELQPKDIVVNDNVEVRNISENTDEKSELSKLDGLLEQVKEEPEKSEVKEERLVADTTMKDPNEVLDESSVITASTTLTGNLTSAGSFDIQGTVNGNVSCNGKLVVTGIIIGNSTCSEFFADVAKIEGEIISTGTVKIGAGSVIIGNITATSAVIAGAVKGDIDVQGPVVIDTSAVIMGNIKSRSVQINNGAIIDGFCSQCYTDVDVQGVFTK